MANIAQLTARQILDAKGNPTVETAVILDTDVTVTASCPSGTSAGSHEAVELRDNDPKHFNGKGVLKAIENVKTTIAKALVGKDPADQKDIDQTLLQLDGTENKSHLGANAMLSVSIACTRAAAMDGKMPLYQHISSLLSPTSPTSLTIPKALYNLINGGLHAGGNVDMQEFIVIPEKAQSFSQGLEEAVLIYNALRKALIEQGFQPLVGDEGGFAPKLKSNEKALALLTEVIAENKLDSGKTSLGIDVAASSFFKNGLYSIKDVDKSITSTELGNFYRDLIAKYHLLYIEDLFAEDDLVGWASFTPQAPQRTIVTGDDLTVTNPKRLEMALAKGMIRGIIIKPNQIGTVSETLDVVRKAKAAGIKTIVSHRSGETNDDFIADFAVGVAADYVKFGAPVRGERVSKYNRLLQIEQELQLMK